MEHMRWATPLITTSSPPPATGCRCAPVVHVPMCRGGEATGGADEHLPSTARIHRCARRHRGMAARGAGAAASDAGDWYLSGRTADTDASLLVSFGRGLADVGYAE